MDNVLDTLVRYGYLVVFGSVLAEQIGIPIPAIPFLLAAGALAGSGRLSLALLLALSGVASLMADVTWYWIGRLGGARVLGWLCRISLEPDSCVRRTQTSFSKHGARTLVFAKFVPGLSTIAPPLAGIVGCPLGRFVFFSAIGGVVWAGAFIVLGWVFSLPARDRRRLCRAVRELDGRRARRRARRLHRWKFVSRQRFLRKIRIARITPEQLKAMIDSGEALLIVGRARPHRLRVRADDHPGCAASDDRGARRASPGDPARARDRPVLHLTQRSLERPCGADPETPRHRARPALWPAGSAPGETSGTR
jgi:membrane protein DedA with SNARE-associated domain